MINLTYAQAVPLGLELGKMLESTAFTTARAILEDDFKSRIINSRHDQTSVREEAYVLHTALQELINTMTSLAIMADGMILQEKMNEQDEQE